MAEQDRAEPDKEQFVASLARGITILKAFRVGSAEMTLSQIADATGFSPAATRRCLLTFVELGYVSKVDKRFVLTPRVLELSAGFLSSMNITTIAAPHLRKVQDVTGDSASLTVLDGPDIMHLCHLPSKGFFQFGLTAGSRVPAHASATGQALLAAQSEDQLTRYFSSAELTRYTVRTLTSEEALRARFAEVRDLGYALLVDELDLGITAIGITLMMDGVPAGGLSCATQSGYLPLDEFVSSRLPALQQAASTLRAEVQNFAPLLHSLSAQGG